MLDCDVQLFNEPLDGNLPWLVASELSGNSILY